jgi:16S rRNA (guanine966-N2)-methyltransferase
VRLTGGELCGRLIAAPKGTSTRPTQDRVRESLFAILGNRINGAIVLDMFAGSGSLGFEALSRGADFCTFIEKSIKTSDLIEANAKALGVSDKCRVITSDSVENQRLWKLYAPFSLVFVDPPYSSGIYSAALETLLDAGVLKPLGIVIVEREKSLLLPQIMGNLKLKRSEKYGATFVDFYQDDAEV